MGPKATSHDAGDGPPLLSGPLEIRTTIYKEVLQGTAFVVDTPIPLCTQAYMRLTPVGKKRLLPDLLRVSKQIRSEALPVFSSTIEPLFGYFTFRLLYPINIPDHYFSHTRKVYVSDYVGNYVPLGQMPMLEVLVHERRQLAKTPHHESRLAKYAQLYERFCTETEAKTPRDRSIQILLHVYFETITDTYSYLDVMIDWKERKVVCMAPSMLPVSSKPALPWEDAKKRRL